MIVLCAPATALMARLLFSLKFTVSGLVALALLLYLGNTSISALQSWVNDSVSQVEQGTNLVNNAGSTMDDIVAQIKRVTDLIGEISAATVEQAQGIARVNESIVGIDQMTQQNSALVEESAAAAASLNEQAHKLNRLVSVFKINS